MSSALIRFFAVVLVWVSTSPSQAGRFYTDFNSGEPDGCRVTGEAMINPGAGVDDSGMLRLTAPERDRQGAFIISDFDGNKPVMGFVADFKMQIGGGSRRGADGVGFNYAKKIPDNIGEAGSASGLVITFDTYNNTDSPPEVILKYENETLKTVKVAKLRTGSDFADVRISLATNRLVTVTYNGKSVLECAVPRYKRIRGGEFGLGARTGSAFDGHVIDELTIVTTVKEPLSPATVSADSAPEP